MLCISYYIKALRATDVQLRAEQNVRYQYLLARVCEAHFCSNEKELGDIMCYSKVPIKKGAMCLYVYLSEMNITQSVQVRRMRFAHSV